MKRILFYGDSNTYGYDPYTLFGGRYDETVRWTDVLALAVEDEWTVFADGQNGRQIPRHTADYGYAIRAINMVTPLSVFAVMLGTNDIFSMIPHEDETNAERVAKRMDDFLQEVLKTPAVQADGMRILLIAPPKMRITPDFFFGGMAEDGDPMTELSLAYRQLADARGYLFADASSWDIDLSPDGVHLSPKGHATMAAHLEQVLRDLPPITEGEVLSCVQT